MKELTIEQKAQRYDEAIEVARKIKNGEPINAPDGTLIPVAIFPELKESEDERIRENIIATIHLYYGEPLEDEAKEMIAWLEKQGKVNETIISQHEDKICKENNDSLTSEDERIRKNLIELFRDTVSNDEIFSDYGLDKTEVLAWLERQSEQKPADRVKPMFKVGDWIIYDRHISKVKDMDSEGYLVEDTYGDEGILPKEFAEKHYHLWTIGEAKDGDVLADNVGVILFKSIGDNNVINYYAYFSGLFAVQEGEHYWGHIRECTLSPATKEQRERFFAAMNDAGWEFDFEKKELKKISQRMISAEAKEAMYGKPAWSGEDETRFESCIKVLQTSDGYDTINAKWLKSLKDRVQPKQEWSEEDKVKINRIVACLENLNVADNDILLKDVAWLKSLKERYTWKPSDEQMHYLSWIANVKLGDSVVEQEVSKHLNGLLEDLKKLKQ